MSSDFQIKIVMTDEIKHTNKVLNCVATLIYKGINLDFIDYIKSLMIRPNQLALVNITFFSDSDKVAPYNYKYLDKKDEIWKNVDYTDGYNGVLNYFYNHITGVGENLDTKRFPFLLHLKGIAYGMLLCCICKAFKLNFITPSSNIILDASGLIIGMDAKLSMKKLVMNYEKIGFSQMFPEHYDYGIESTFVPMIGKVKDIINVCTFDNISRELLENLPIKMCKDICTGTFAKVLRDVSLGKDILTEYKDQKIPRDVLLSRLDYLKSINQGFVDCTEDEFGIICFGEQ